MHSAADQPVEIPEGSRCRVIMQPVLSIFGYLAFGLDLVVRFRHVKGEVIWFDGEDGIELAVTADDPAVVILPL